MPGPIGRVTPANALSAQWTQGLVDLANVNTQFSGTGEIDVESTPAGRGILHNPLYRRGDIRWAVIIAPEDSIYTYPDARYRLQMLRLKNSNDTGLDPPTVYDNLQFEPELSPDLFPEGGDNGLTGTDLDVGNHFTAVHLGEITTVDLKSASGTHTIIENSTVIVQAFCIYDNEHIPQAHWFFFRPPPALQAQYDGMFFMAGPDHVASASWGHVHDMNHPS